MVLHRKPITKSSVKHFLSYPKSLRIKAVLICEKREISINEFIIESIEKNVKEHKRLLMTI